MGTQELKTRNCFELRADYDAAFASWARQVATLQLRTADPGTGGALVENARQQTEEAQIIYRQRRDLLLQCMLK